MYSGEQAVIVSKAQRDLMMNIMTNLMGDKVPTDMLVEIEVTELATVGAEVAVVLQEGEKEGHQGVVAVVVLEGAGVAEDAAREGVEREDSAELSVELEVEKAELAVEGEVELAVEREGEEELVVEQGADEEEAEAELEGREAELGVEGEEEAEEQGAVELEGEEELVVEHGAVEEEAELAVELEEEAGGEAPVQVLEQLLFFTIQYSF